MDLAFTDADLRFQQDVRNWIATAYTPELRAKQAMTKNGYLDKEGMIAWQRILDDRGFFVPNWPEEHGGPGLSPSERYILQMELAAAGTPNTSPMGISMVAPVIMAFGNDAQKAEHLPKIKRSEVWWCQGYSEPGAGSDLAGLQTKCEDKGDHYLINGQKVWTSYADQADWIFCLVRTDTSKKHEGISFILFDMETEGVEARPIKLISGSSPFCETFFTDVKVPKDQLVGHLNGGWAIAKRLLQFERSSISAGGFGGTGGSGILGPDEYAKIHVGVDGDGKVADGDLRGRIADHKMYARAFSLTVQRSQEQAKAGQEVGHTASILKYGAAKMNQERHELLIEALGTEGFGWDGEGFDESAMKATRGWLRSKGNSIEGGTSEINLNVIAKRVLGLRDHQ